MIEVDGRKFQRIVAEEQIIPDCKGCAARGIKNNDLCIALGDCVDGGDSTNYIFVEVQ